MAGHSQFKNIMRRKGAQDAKRGKLFTKLGREIVVAAKSGLPDPAMNPRLRAAISEARVANMPKDRIEQLIKKATGAGDTESYEEIRYEGYGAGGVAVIVEAMTDNRNRTAPEIRAAFAKYGGNLGETGSVGFMFNRVGMVRFLLSVADEEKMFDAAIEAGADNCEVAGDMYEITSSVESFSAMRDGLATKFGEPASAKLVWQPVTTSPVDEETATKVMKLIEVLEDNDDVQEVYANFEISEELAQKLAS